MKRTFVVACLAAMLGVASHPLAQSAAAPAFEVASVEWRQTILLLCLRPSGKSTEAAAVRRLCAPVYIFNRGEDELGPSHIA